MVNNLKTYRVFVHRYYIAVTYFDIQSPNEKEAKKAAVKAAKKLKPDVRLEATDNGWIADDPTLIPHLGYAATDFIVEEVLETSTSKVYQDTRK
jgi:hypothetical protein